MCVRVTCDMKEQTVNSYMRPVPLESLPRNGQLETEQDDDFMLVDPWMPVDVWGTYFGIFIYFNSVWRTTCFELKILSPSVFYKYFPWNFWMLLDALGLSSSSIWVRADHKASKSSTRRVDGRSTATHTNTIIMAPVLAGCARLTSQNLPVPPSPLLLASSHASRTLYTIAAARLYVHAFVEMFWAAEVNIYQRWSEIGKQRQGSRIIASDVNTREKDGREKGMTERWLDTR